MTEAQQRRVREMRSRVLARSFELRQIGHARGVWFRLRRALTSAREAYALFREDAERLLAEGRRPEPVGAELEPPRIVLFVEAERVAGVASARPLEVRLSADLLSAEALALVPFDLR